MAIKGSNASLSSTFAVKEDGLDQFEMKLGDLTDRERQIIADGCLINFNRAGQK